MLAGPQQGSPCRPNRRDRFTVQPGPSRRPQRSWILVCPAPGRRPAAAARAEILAFLTERLGLPGAQQHWTGRRGQTAHSTRLTPNMHTHHHGGHVEVERCRAALRRHRWCCDNGRPRRPGRSGIRAGFRRLARPGIRAASRLVPRRQGRRGEGRRARAAPGVRAPEAVQRPARLAHTRVSGSLVSSAVRAGRVFGPVGPHRRTAGF